MTEKEKMIAEQLYFSGDEQLVDDRLYAKALCYDYNKMNPVERLKGGNVIINKLFGKIGANFCIEPSFWCDYGYNIEIGDNFYSNHNLVILDCAKIKIGNNVFIAPNCGIYAATHPVDAETRNSGLEYAKAITIGNNVWIGGGVTILPGVTIGDNCVIGAGSVVVKSIEANSIAVGNPCKRIKSV